MWPWVCPLSTLSLNTRFPTVIERRVILLVSHSCWVANKKIMVNGLSVQFSRSVVSDFATPWIAACQISMSITNSQMFIKFMSIKSVMPSSHLILCRTLLFLTPIPPSIRVVSNESTLRMRCPKYWSFSFSMVHIRPKSKLNGDTIPHQQRGCLKTSIVSSKHAPKHGLALHRAKTQFHSSVDRHWPFAPGSLH